jgi:heat shock transcription factor, other eukaryote
MQIPYLPPSNTTDQSTSWNTSNLDFMENSANANPYGMVSSPRPAQFTQQGIPIATPSTTLARRGINNQLVAANRSYTPQPNEAWANYGDESLVSQQNGSNAVDEHDNVELLEEKAQKAKREAQAKRKQIPPFVQKLNRLVIAVKRNILPCREHLLTVTQLPRKF